MCREHEYKAYIKNDYNSEFVGKIFNVSSIHLKSRKVIIGYSLSKTYYGNRSFLFDNIVLMQYIGIKDKNNNKIYETDIIKLTKKRDVAKSVIAEVEWSDEYLSYILISFSAKDAFENLSDYLDEYDIEVIGNIYKNPELLGGNQNDSGIS